MPYPERPLYDLLPDSWDPDGVLSALVRPSDDKLKAIADLLESWYRYVSPETCPDKALDWLADFYGLPLWASRWSNTQKRNILKAMKVLRRLRGTEKALRTALDALGISYTLSRNGASYLPLRMSSPMFSGDYRLFIKLPRAYPYAGPAFQDARASVNALLPAGTEAIVCHEHYYLGLTPMSHPMFS